jgi:hypothetical protein
MTMQVRKAERRKAKLRLGVAGPSGSGKTMSSLLMAFGITGDWSKIGLVDTEAGSGELYVGQKVKGTDIVIGDYNYLRIEPDYTVNKYLEAMRLMAAAGVDCCILDSASHAWSGIGGLLDKQGKIAARSGNSYTAWRDVTPDHNNFVDSMLSSPFHLIVTMRAKQEYVLEENEKGKKVPKKVGMAPVQREGMEYEFTVMLDIDMGHVASASKDRTNTLDGRFFKVSPETGKELLAWLETGKEPEPVPEASPAPEVNPLVAWSAQYVADLQTSETLEMFESLIKANAPNMGRLAKEGPKRHARLQQIIAERREELSKPKTSAMPDDDLSDLAIPAFLNRNIEAQAAE